MKIGVIGTGFIGLILGGSLAACGNQVIGYDINDVKIELLTRGQVPIREPGLASLVARQIEEERLRFCHNIAEAVRGSEVVFITVPTPSGESGAADLSQVSSVAAAIGDAIDSHKVIVIKSTVPVGTAALVESIIASRTTQDFAVVSNPEFLREGSALSDFQSPSRIIIGTDDQGARAILTRLYRPFGRENQRLFFMDTRSAELTKYATNAMLALRVSFMNEMSALCEATGADVESVRQGLGADPRIGWRFLSAGIGYGGSCFPKDIEALINIGLEYNTPVPILEAAHQVNQAQWLRLLDKILDHFNDNIEQRCFALWGVTYKPNTDDIRESPAISILRALLERGARIQVFDPAGMPQLRACFGHRVDCVDDEYDALQGADGLIIATDWSLFRTPDFQRIANTLNEPVVFDGRNIYDPVVLEEFGLLHYSIGRRNPDSMTRWERQVPSSGEVESITPEDVE